jgi:hypothetical protein
MYVVLYISGWIVWGIAAVVAFSSVSYMRGEAKKNKPIHMLAVFQGVLMLSTVGAFVFVPWSKLNLIWVMPAAFFGAFLGPSWTPCDKRIP